MRSRQNITKERGDATFQSIPPLVVMNGAEGLVMERIVAAIPNINVAVIRNTGDFLGKKI